MLIREDQVEVAYLRCPLVAEAVALAEFPKGKDHEPSFIPCAS